MSEKQLFPHGKLDSWSLSLIERVSAFTMTTPEAIYNLAEATKYAARNSVPGDVVECGVWKGGSAMAAAFALLSTSDESKSIWMYDTYTGMPKATIKDVNFKGVQADKVRDIREQAGSGWCFASINEVKTNLAKTKFPASRLVFVKGLVEETIPANMPEKISLLRLDTDFYQSTSWALQHLYPRVSCGGICIFDDYDCWDGAKSAVDEYFETLKRPPLLIRMDAGRIMIKLED